MTIIEGTVELHHAQSNPLIWGFNVSLYSSIFFIQFQIKIIARQFQMHLVSCPQGKCTLFRLQDRNIRTHAVTHGAREKTIKVLYFFLLLLFQRMLECVSFSPSLPPPRDPMTRDRSN